MFDSENEEKSLNQILNLDERNGKNVICHTRKTIQANYADFNLVNGLAQYLNIAENNHVIMIDTALYELPKKYIKCYNIYNNMLDENKKNKLISDQEDLIKGFLR